MTLIGSRPRLTLADRGRGRPVLFQHGLCGDAGQPEEVFPLDHFRCLTVECRGHGASESGDVSAFGIATFAEDIAAILDSMRIAPLPIGGMSMGAAIALRLAVTRPDLVSALILARPAWIAEPAPMNMQANAGLGGLLAAHEADEARALFELTPIARELAIAAPGNLASLRSFFARAPRAITAELLVRISADGPGVSLDDIRAIRVPTLVIGHGRDRVHPLATAEALASLIPRALLAIIPSKADDLAGHKAQFRAAIHAFLEEHEQ